MAINWLCPSKIGEYFKAPASFWVYYVSILRVNLAVLVFLTMLLYLSANAINVGGKVPPDY